MKNKDLKFILIVVIILLVGGIGFYFLIAKRNGSPTANSGQSSFPNENSAGNSLQTGTIANNGSTGNEGTSTGQVSSAVPLPELRQISTVPVAGAIAFDMATGTGKTKQTETVIRFMESSNGHVDETRTDTLATNQISVTTIPTIQNAVWSSTGASAYVQYLDSTTQNIDTYYGQLKAVPPQPAQSAPAATTSSTASQTAPVVSYATYQIVGSFLPSNIVSLIPSKTKSQIAYLEEGSAGSEVVLAKPDGTGSSVLLDSPLREWLMSPVNNTTLSLTTKASAASPGYMYLLNMSGGAFTKILGGYPGLTGIVDPTAQKIFFTDAENNSISGGLYTIATGATSAFPAATLPEKCVWSTLNTTLIYCAVPTSIPSGSYPDAWYQGLVSFNDQFWRINTETGTSTLLADPSTLANVQVDGTKLFLDNRENYLFFTDKKTGDLWSIDLNQALQ